MSYEIECPVCDRKAPASAGVCPHCGADLAMASFDELEEVAQAIASGKRPDASAEQKPAPKPQEKATEPMTAHAPEPEGEAKSAEEPQPIAEERPAEKPKEAKPAEEEKKEEEGKKGLGRLFGRKKK